MPCGLYCTCVVSFRRPVAIYPISEYEELFRVRRPLNHKNSFFDPQGYRPCHNSHAALQVHCPCSCDGQLWRDLFLASQSRSHIASGLKLTKVHIVSAPRIVFTTRQSHFRLDCMSRRGEAGCLNVSQRAGRGANSRFTDYKQSNVRAMESKICSRLPTTASHSRIQHV